MIGVTASGESETTRNNRTAMRQRTFLVGGAPVTFDLHAKPTDSVPPPQCVRIYFDLQDQAPHLRIGYLGRHFA